MIKSTVAYIVAIASIVILGGVYVMFPAYPYKIAVESIVAISGLYFAKRTVQKYKSFQKVDSND